MSSPDTRAQLLASNLQFLLQYLSGEVPPREAPTPAQNPGTESAGGALYLTAVAQKRGSGL